MPEANKAALRRFYYVALAPALRRDTRWPAPLAWPGQAAASAGAEQRHLNGRHHPGGRDPQTMVMTAGYGCESQRCRLPGQWSER